MNPYTEAERGALEARAASGAGWFYWIAGLSVINSIVAATGSSWGFMAGLGLTQVIDGIGQSIGTLAKPVTLVLDGMVASVFVGLGWWARKKTWVYATGMALYALDSIVFAVAGDWIGFGFHGLVLFFLWGGFTARRALDALPAATAAPAENPASEVDRAA